MHPINEKGVTKRGRRLDLFGYRDFTMAVQEIGLDAESLPLLHLDGAKLRRPYFVALREHNKDAMFLDMTQVEWQKNQILARVEADSTYIDTLLRKTEDVCLPLMPLLNNPKPLSREALKTFAEDLRLGWRWYAGLWWAIEGLEQKDLYPEQLEQCMAFRKKTENFCPGADTVMRESVRNLYPALERYVEVVLITEVVEEKIPSKNELEKRLKRCLLIDHKIYVDEDIEKMQIQTNIELVTPSLLIDHKIYVDEDIEKMQIQTNIELVTPKPEGGEQKILTGQSAFKGIYTGKVSIVFTKKDAHAFHEGDVLVASSSTPDFLPAIRKAGAIVADEGGIMSHAAICSREFKIPCVIGTKFATQVLHDGDVVEVDAERGVVRILKRHGN